MVRVWIDMPPTKKPPSLMLVDSVTHRGFNPLVSVMFGFVPLSPHHRCLVESALVRNPIMRKKTGHHGFYGQMVSMDHGIKMRVQYLAL